MTEKPNAAVIEETKYIAVVVAMLSLLMEAVFLILNRWSLSVLLGNLLSGALMIGNFFGMGMTIQKALCQDPEDAKKRMKASQSIRTLLLFVVIVIGVVLPWFNTVAVILPVFFPRFAIALRPLLKPERKDVSHHE